MIFYKGEQVAAHVRNYKQGDYSTVREHLCSHHQHYRDRSPEYYQRLANKQSDTLGALVKELFNQGRHPEQLYRTCDGLLSLSRKADAAAFEKACKMAIEHKIFSYRFIKNILENKMEDEEIKSTQKALPKHNNVRGRGYYEQLEINFKP